ncbi:MAG: hypothetical protein Q8N56_04245, partial [bacterium]|nr:hypothetical protein [bacterium]
MASFSISVKKYISFFKNQFSATIYYRGSIFIWIFSNLLYLVVIASVWLSSDAGDLIAGYTKKGLIS